MPEVSAAAVSATPLAWTAFVALDWGDQKHYWKLTAAGSDRFESGELDNTPEAVQAWAIGLEQRFGAAVALCLEQKRGALVYMLARHAHVVLFTVHPKTAADYRRTFCPSGAKSDAQDAGWLLDLLLRHRDRLQQLRPDTTSTRLLQRLVEHRRRLVDEKTRQKNRLTACLKNYFPQLLSWFDDVERPIVAALLDRWPTLDQLQRAHRGTWKRFLQQHNCRSEERIRERIAAVEAAVPATHDEAVLESESLIAASCVALLRTLQERIAILDKRIAEVLAAHPERDLFASLPGAGPALQPRLLVAFGTQRDRYPSAADLQQLSGIAPVTEASGNTRWVHFRQACPKFLRQTFQEFAGQSIRYSAWARAYYDHQVRDKHKSHNAAIRALAFKWIRVIHSCWKQRQPYSEASYLAALHKRNSSLDSLIPGLRWQTAAGFQRLCADSA
jgi:transposase